MRQYEPIMASARGIATRFDWDAVIVIGFDGPCFAVGHYGRNGGICDAVSGTADGILHMLERGEIDTGNLCDAIEVLQAYPPRKRRDSDEEDD